MIQVPTAEDSNALADWIELSCLFGGSSFIPRSEISSALESAGFRDPDTATADIWVEIAHRREIAQFAYPFVGDKHGVEAKGGWKSVLPYAFQLLVATHSMYAATQIPKARWNATAKLFELLASSALQTYLKGNTLNVGAPRAVGIPTGFRDCLDFNATSLGEARGPVVSYNAHAQDERVDIVGWVPFPDKRSGQVIILVNCAAGKNWRSKSTELSGYLRVWREYVDWSVEPITALAVPFVCHAPSDWDYLSRQAGVLFDRLRIALMLSDGIPTPAIRKALTTWCTDQLRTLPVPA